jgi:hypothetical protein
LNELTTIAAIAPRQRYTIELLAGNISSLPILDESGRGEVTCQLGGCPCTAIRHAAMRWAFGAHAEPELDSAGLVRLRAFREPGTLIVDALIGFRLAEV